MQERRLTGEAPLQLKPQKFTLASVSILAIAKTISQILNVVIPNISPCHSERSEESEIAACKPVFDFRFLALLEMTQMNCICEIVSYRTLTVTHMPDARIIALLLLLLADGKVGMDPCSDRHSSNWHEKQRARITPE